MNKAELLKLYRKSPAFRHFMKEYVQDYLQTVRGRVIDIETMIRWDKEDIATHYEVAIAKRGSAFVGISFCIGIGARRKEVFRSVPYERFNYIYGTWVSPSWRGRGINHELVAMFRSSALPTVVMIANANEASQRSYAKADFRKVDWPAYEGTQFWLRSSSNAGAS